MTGRCAQRASLLRRRRRTDARHRDAQFGRTPLSWAAGMEGQDPELVKALLERGADVDGADAARARSLPASWGAASPPRGVHAAQPALTSCAALHAQASEQPLHWAARAGNEECARLLLNLKPDAQHTAPGAARRAADVLAKNKVRMPHTLLQTVHPTSLAQR